MTQSLPSSDGGDFVEGRLLDGFLLLAAGGSSSPEDVVSVNLSSLQIVEVAAEDLSFFGNLDSLDVSDNQLGDEAILEQFGRIPRLTRLLLSCNAISALQVPSQGSLRMLETLDLSFNELHGDVLAQVAHLPRLVTLNLCSNCISSVPPEEELYGLQSLEELSLDANDLVQFVQWRALDVLPRLRKLSVASNRVKRLKDDAPDHADGTQISYFQSLEELDLSSNEIVHVEDLCVVKQFKSLKKLILSDNPCSKTAAASQHTMQGMKFQVQDSKPFYLKGGGSFMRKAKPTEPTLKINHKTMAKVRSSGKVGTTTKARLSSQLGVLDVEANQLLVDLRSGPQAGGYAPTTAAVQKSLPTTFLTSPGAPAFSDIDYSEEELARIFKEQSAKIQNAFNLPVEEPVSFRRVPPFTSVSASAAGQKLLQQGSTGRQEEDASGGAGAGGAVGGPSSTRPSSTFMTGMGEEMADSAGAAGQREPRGQRLASAQGPSTAGTSPSAFFGKGAEPAALGSSTSGANLILPKGMDGGLPPIEIPGQPGSRGSSAGGVSRGDPLDMMLRDNGARAKPMPDIGVREAMKALRAAAMSEFAVAA